jgi:hypothetical protein
MDIANIAKLVLFISACASLFGLGLFLFRDHIFSQTDASTHPRHFLNHMRSEKDPSVAHYGAKKPKV